MIPQIIAKPLTVARQLTLEELKLQFPMKILGDVIIIESSLGYKLKQPIEIKRRKFLQQEEKGLIHYIVSAFLSERPAIISYVFDNQSLCSGSHPTVAAVTLFKFKNTLHGLATAPT